MESLRRAFGNLGGGKADMKELTKEHGTERSMEHSKEHSTEHQTEDETPSEDYWYIWSPDLLPVTFDGHYEEHILLGQMIANGGFGEIRFGMMRATDEFVAVKKIEVRSDCKSSLDRITREVKALRSLRHKNIVLLKGVYTMPNHVALVLEMMNLNLWKLVLSSSLSMGERLEMAVLHEVLQGLAFMHSKHVVHQDIKPENILVSMQDNICIKICDFGCSERAGITDGFNGTTKYLSPERLESMARDSPWRPASPASDIWALGITWVSITTRNTPFETSDTTCLRQFMRGINQFPLNERLMEKKAQRSPLWRNLVGKCLVMDVQSRATAASLLRHPYLHLRASLELLRPYISQALGIKSRRNKVNE